MLKLSKKRNTVKVKTPIVNTRKYYLLENSKIPRVCKYVESQGCV